MGETMTLHSVIIPTILKQQLVDVRHDAQDFSILDDILLTIRLLEVSVNDKFGKKTINDKLG